MNRDLSDLSQQTWDAVVIGAGPAGAVAAALLAAKGGRTLLLEKSCWPRDKVCGGCLNAAAVASLADAGLVAAIRGAQPIDRVAWYVGANLLELAAPGGVAILRSDFDAALVAIAVERGCHFHHSVCASLLPPDATDYRILKLQSGTNTVEIRARTVLACDGIGGTSLARETWATWDVVPRSMMGVSATCADWSDAKMIGSGVIQMHIGRGGYVGMVRLPRQSELDRDEAVHLAAALDPTECRKIGGPATLVARILESCGLSLPHDLMKLRFRGSPALTRRRQNLGGHRVLAVGDACGYVEPFTGEGMAWAIDAARQSVALLPAPSAAWPANTAGIWKSRHDQMIRRRQRFCRLMRPMMHHPGLASAGIAIARAAQVLSKWLTRRVSQSRLPEGMHGSFG